MREQILRALKAHYPTPISGEALSEQLNISRTAIWKHMQVLKKSGYVIGAYPKKGYVLEQVPDKVLTVEVQSYLQTKWLGRDIRYQEIVDSTNTEAKRLTTNGEKSLQGVVCVCEEQRGGHGRLSRHWYSPYAGGLWFSVILQPHFTPEDTPKCTLLTAVAVAQALQEYTKLEVGIKWPNDILVQGKKLVGILTEMSAEFGRVNNVVIGIGINTNMSTKDLPPDIKGTAVALEQLCKKKLNRAELLALVLGKLEALYEEAEAHGFDAIMELWRYYSDTLGREVTVSVPGETYHGKALDIDDNGYLVVERSSGKLERVIAGDVCIRHQEGKGSKK